MRIAVGVLAVARLFLGDIGQTRTGRSDTTPRNFSGAGRLDRIRIDARMIEG